MKINSIELELAHYIKDFSFEDLNHQDLIKIKHLIFDLIGCGVGGSSIHEGKKLIGNSINSSEQCSVIGSEKKVNIETSIYNNSKLINLLDCDETFMMQSHHAQSSFAAALSCIEFNNLSGKELIISFTIGFELASRVARFLGTGLKLDPSGKAKGWSGLVGPITCVYASAIATTKALNFTINQIVETLRLVVAYCPMRVAGWSNSQVLSSVKYIDTGWAALSGFKAAMMAKDGYTGVHGIFDLVLSESLNRTVQFKNELIKNDNDLLWIHSTSIKKWPCCRWMHYPLSAFYFLLEENNISAEEINRIDLFTFPKGYASDCFKNKDIKSNVDAMFSYPHTCSMLAFRIPPGPNWFSKKNINNHQISIFRDKIYLNEEPKSLDPKAWKINLNEVRIPSKAIIETNEKKYVKEINYSIGDPWVSNAKFKKVDYVEKFINLSNSTSLTNEIYKLVEYLDSSKDLSIFYSLLRTLKTN